ncbi:MAG: adenosylcobinamide-GDP ribazoletransferase [Deltaproteobacteria bacterium]|nr:MAG: adenosylcobinamide-GDP ribazoletransferase [Deltaproteobacteria bacterium]
MSGKNKNLFGGLLAAVSFLTIFPVGRAVQNEDDFKRGLIWFPLVGLGIGVLAAGIVWMLSLLLPLSLVSLTAVFLLSFISGFLHVDGLADTADGFLSSRPKEQMLAIMRDSRIGVMGAASLIFLFLCKYAALASMNLKFLLLSCLIMPIVGRCAITVQMTMLPYAGKPGGLGNIFASSGLKRACLLSVLFLAAATALMFYGQGIKIIAVFLIFNLFFAGWCKRKIGGYTGDTLGAACELSELAAALSLCINLR